MLLCGSAVFYTGGGGEGRQMTFKNKKKEASMHLSGAAKQFGDLKGQILSKPKLVEIP